MAVPKDRRVRHIPLYRYGPRSFSGTPIKGVPYRNAASPTSVGNGPYGRSEGSSRASHPALSIRSAIILWNAHKGRPLPKRSVFDFGRERPLWPFRRIVACVTSRSIDTVRDHSVERP